MSVKSCSSCGNETLEPGFLMDAGQSSQGAVRWVQGTLERGIFGGAKLWGRPKTEVETWRCTSCSKLELYAADPVY